MKHLLFSTIALFMLVTQAHAREPYVGLSAFAAFNNDFPCRNYLATFKGVTKPAMSVVWHTFDTRTQYKGLKHYEDTQEIYGQNIYDKNGCPERFLRKFGLYNPARPSSHKSHLLQIFLFNTACAKSSACANNEEIFKGYSAQKLGEVLDGTHGQDEKKKAEDKIREVATGVRTWLKASQMDIIATATAKPKREYNTKRKIVITPALEDNIKSKAAIERINQIVLEVFKGAGLGKIIIGRNPWKDFGSSGNVTLLDTMRVSQKKVVYELHPYIKDDLSKNADGSSKTFSKNTNTSTYWDEKMDIGNNRRCIANLDGVSVWTGAAQNSATYTQEKAYHTKDQINITTTDAQTFLKNHKSCLAVFLWYAPLQGYYTDHTEKEQRPAARERTFALSDHATQQLRSVMTALTVTNSNERSMVLASAQHTQPYQIRSLHADKCLDVESAGRHDGAKLQQNACRGATTPSHAWLLKPINDSDYQIVSANSGKCMDVEGVAYHNGARVQQYQCLGAHQHNQLWQLRYTGAGIQIVAKHSGKCLDVASVSQSNGAHIQQWDCLGASQTNQLWTLNNYREHKVGIRSYWGTYLGAHPNTTTYANTPNLLTWETWSLVDLGNHRVALRSFHDTYLTAYRDGSTQASAKSIKDWEIFTVVPQEDGYFSLRSAHGGYLVVLPEGTLRANSSNVQTWERFSLSSPYANTDDDGDQVPDIYDNCLNLKNSEQIDIDYDSRGDACDRFVPTTYDEGLVFYAHYYLGLYPDLQAAFGRYNYAAARDHWHTYGIHEGRRASPVFAPMEYLSNHIDLINTYGGNNYAQAINHYLKHGVHEGRRGANNFHVLNYLNRYSDLRNAFGLNYEAATYHFIETGYQEDRAGH